MVRPMVHSRKHYVQQSLATILAGVADDIIIAFAKETADAADEVKEGNSIKAVWIEMWIRTQSTSPGSVLATLYKMPGDGSVMLATDQAALHDYANKKNVLYHTQGLTNDQDADAIPFIRQWFKIPKGKQRFGLGDALRLSIFAQGALDLTICGFMTYKEYS